MSSETLLTGLIFLSFSSFVLLIYSLVSTRGVGLGRRLESLGDSPTTTAAPRPAPVTRLDHLKEQTLPRLGARLMPEDEKERSRLKTRLVQAGFYSNKSLALFLGVKLLLMIAPALAGLALGAFNIVPLHHGVLGGMCVGIIGMVGPSFWLDSQKKQRQMQFRRSLPDAMDLLVICLEGGLSLPGSLKRVATDLRTAHPALSGELMIVQREIQLGRSGGEALQQMGLRTDLEEVRSLSSVIIQSERFGASLVKSLRVHADTLRLKRQQRAEEMAQKAATKVLIPTILFIFPATFIVVLGPAVYQLIEFFQSTKPPQM